MYNFAKVFLKIVEQWLIVIHLTPSPPLPTIVYPQHSFYPIRDEDLKKPKQQNQIKDSKSTTNLDSSPVKKSRQKVARVLEDSSDEENDAMDTTTTTLTEKQEAQTNGVDTNKSESKVNGTKENATQKMVNGHKNTDESKGPASPTDDDFIPKRTTGLCMNFKLCKVVLASVLEALAPVLCELQHICNLLPEMYKNFFSLLNHTNQ